MVKFIYIYVYLYIHTCTCRDEISPIPSFYPSPKLPLAYSYICSLVPVHLSSTRIRREPANSGSPAQERAGEGVGNKATLQPPRPVQVRLCFSRQGSGSLLSIVGKCCMRRTVTYDASVRANCSGVICVSLLGYIYPFTEQERWGWGGPVVRERRVVRLGTYGRCRSSARR